MTTIRYEVKAEFHGGDPYSAHSTLAGARREQARHAKECQCGTAIVVTGSPSDLSALGAYVCVGGDWIVELGGERYVCECADGESEG